MESLFPGDPCPPRPTGPLEPSLRPHIQGVWVLPPGTWHQAHTPQRGNPDPSARSGPAHETPASTPTSLPGQAAVLHPSQVGMWAHVDRSRIACACHVSQVSYRTTAHSNITEARHISPYMFYSHFYFSSGKLTELPNPKKNQRILNPSDLSPPHTVFIQCTFLNTTMSGGSLGGGTK